MAHEVKTPVFEGPLDLLLQLISRHQVDVTQVNLSDLVDDYVATVAEMHSRDLEVMSEFVLIAATLMQLKARVLLPEESAIDLDEELGLLSERDRLLARLLQCVTFKDVAAVFSHRMREADRYTPRRVGLDRPVAQPSRPVELGAGKDELVGTARRVFADFAREVDTDHLDLELPSVDEALAELRERIQASSEATFSGLVAHCERPVEIVAYFLALLELARWGAVHLSQEDWLSDISVSSGDASLDAMPESEWSR